MKKQEQQVKESNITANGKKFRKFAYILAWVSFLSVIGSSIFNAIKDKDVPDKDDYYK